MPRKNFTLDIEPEAFDDIQEAVDFYNSRKSGLGKRFYNTVDKHFDFLKKNCLSPLLSVMMISVACPLKSFRT
jgi:hypothetical protein